MPAKKSLLTTIIIIVLMLVGAALGVYSTRFYPSGPSPQSIQGLLWPNPKQLGEFSMVDHNGNTFGINHLQDKWSLLFFGYTYCPDVCPLTLSVLEQVYSRIRQQQNLPSLQILFITVDPGRDTTERLADYIRYFNNDFIALGGTAGQVNSLASQIGIAYGQGTVMDDSHYLINHTSSVFLLDPRARLVGIFSAPHDPDTLMTGLVNISGFINSRD